MRRSLGKNLDAAGLRNAKKRWTKQVQDVRSRVATVGGQLDQAESSFFMSGITWGYINHKRVVQMVDPAQLDGHGGRLYRECLNRGLVDERGLIVLPAGSRPGSSPMSSTIYDHFGYGDDHRIHLLYTEMADHIASSKEVIHIERESWTRARLKALLEPGSLLFMKRALYFKTVQSTAHNEHRKCRYFKSKIEVEFFMDTVDMFGTTSISTSFSGHQSAAALLQLKSMGSEKGGRWKLNCTPLALGVGFTLKSAATE